MNKTNIKYKALFIFRGVVMTNLEIEAFFAVAKCGTVSAAAKQLYVTQPALSKRIKTLEEEVGYQLFLRQKGVREVQLTKEGREFLAVAGKWKRLWEETSRISSGKQQKKLVLSSIGSVSSYIFPEVFREFLNENKDYHLTFYNYHSVESYSYAESGLVDLAFVTDQRYSRGLKVVPAFSEPFVLAGGASLPESESVCVEKLNPAGEVRLPWNNEYDQWHLQHFPDSIYPHVYLDQMSLMEEFLNEETWAIVPVSVGYKLAGKGVLIRSLTEGPPNRLIYYLLKEENENPLIRRFLYYLNGYLLVQEGVNSYLGNLDFQ